MKQTALVLEGGALRGIYSAGVMDVFAENDLLFPYVIGISAGALNGLSYIAGQTGRNAKVTMEFANDNRYLSFRNFIKNQAIFNFDFMFGELSHTLVPFDYAAFEASPQRFVAVATNCATGEAEYFEKGICDDIYTASAASGSMPLFSKPVSIGNSLYLDGGIGIPTGLPEAMRQGYQKIVVVLTRQKGYRKAAVSKPVQALYKKAFAQYPALVEKLISLPERYNAALNQIDAWEAQGKLFVIRPQKPVEVGRMEKDVRKLEQLYWEGRMETEALLPSLLDYIQNN